MAVRQRWLARIWPAIALDGGIGRASVSLAAAMAAGLFRPAAVVVAEALSLASSTTPSPADPPLAGLPGPANGPSQRAPHPIFPGAAVTADGEEILYLLALAVLLALLGTTVWREFRSALRPRRIRWHL